MVNSVQFSRDLLTFSFIIGTSFRPYFVPNWFRSTSSLHISVITGVEGCLIGIFSKSAPLPFDANNPFISVVTLNIFSTLHLCMYSSI